MSKESNRLTILPAESDFRSKSTVPRDVNDEDLGPPDNGANFPKSKNLYRFGVPIRPHKKGSSLSTLKEEVPRIGYHKTYNIDQAGPGVIALGDVQGLPTFLIKKREIAKSWKFCKAAHENLELLVDFYVDSSSLWLVYEYEHLAVSLGCVAGIVDFSEADVATVCRETLRGLAVIHSELGISHGSVNCSNILLNWKGEIKLGRRNYPLLLGLAHDLSANVGDSMLRGRTSSASKADVEGVGSIAISLSDSTTLISGESPAESTLSDLVRNFIKTSKEKPAKELLYVS
ncbi:hypothetical protein M752DRAFT_267379 [Aspergillus phoenicis ATCC 13157]|uniref:Protein kinase domain-containing protein n=1 Tax=Aspergillus phoenicis ATCC 13157 TaxID=1353007 RepID=A0A370PFU6_ASPPH|nr:hypothetical protein M752DRAFT_267379 [Aspergillus phoenicis ATCC 13157]GLA32612.1 hypothetical protein AnigIFM63326_000821 [Aspergillus niger]